jgi:hypothetical protein
MVEELYIMYFCESQEYERASTIGWKHVISHVNTRGSCRASHFPAPTHYEAAAQKVICITEEDLFHQQLTLKTPMFKAWSALRYLSDRVIAV